MKISPIPSGLNCVLFFVALLFTGFSSKAFTVSNFASEYHNGQVFLTWATPNVKNLQLPASSTGIFLAQVRCELFSHSGKLFFKMHLIERLTTY